MGCGVEPDKTRRAAGSVECEGKEITEANTSSRQPGAGAASPAFFHLKNDQMRVLDLFAGIGGFSLAAHWMGWETVGFVEWDDFNQKVLAKNFPGVPISGDMREYKGQRHAADIICGGFPCQPFSTAGKRQGTNDERYLWPEMLRVIREVQPTYVVGENVAGIYSMDDGRVFEQVCADLESEDYEVQPFCIPACATGAPHRRDRWWFIAHASIEDDGRHTRESKGRQKSQFRNGIKPGAFANPNGTGLQNPVCKQLRCVSETVRTSKGSEFSRAITAAEQWGVGWHETATRLCRVDDGLPAWVDADRTNRLKSLGNAIVPQVAYQIFRAIQESQ